MTETSSGCPEILFNNKEPIQCPSELSPSATRKVHKPHNHQSDEDSVCADLWGSSSLEDSCSQYDSDKVRELEEEQNRLNESVLSLSTHFAHIQFRIQQISNAPAEKRDEMLKELQEFASKGCIDISQVRQETEQLKSAAQTEDQSVREKKDRVLNLISHLRTQLEDLEQFAYENGHGGIPLIELKQRQKMVFDKLQEKIRLKIELETLPAYEIGKNLDDGLEQILNPIKEKDKLVDQLQTQIIDLERFVSFLQQEINASTNGLPLDEDNPIRAISPDSISAQCTARSLESTYKMAPPQRSSSIMKLFGCRTQREKFERNELKRTPVGNHYGDQRAELELAVDQVHQILQKYQILSVDRSEREALSVEQLNESIFECSEEAIVAVVRKTFCPALKALLEHGLRDTVGPSSSQPVLTATAGSIFGIGCFPNRTAGYGRRMRQEIGKLDGRKIEHIWDLIQLFYECSKALEMREAAAGRLTQAFKLDSTDGKTTTSKQILLSTIESVTSTHSRLKRSRDCMWKAFVSSALNHNRLPAWIRIIFRWDLIVSKCYHSWSYVCRTGCEDIRPLLERLHDYTFDLPVDLAVRPFEHIKEAF
ncbi:RUN domain-containing protein [Ditylenchus destructor]|nr:RUN domain-containing protein [Ditylenchus destructor]